jgi:hypothetical protein
LRGINETETTRDFVRAVRSTLLEGPFSRPATLLDADDRLLATFRRKIDVLGRAVNGVRQANPAGLAGGMR